MADETQPTNDCTVKQCPMTLTVSNLVIDSERHLAQEQAKIRRKKYLYFHRKFHSHNHHSHQHMTSCPLHPSHQTNDSPHVAKVNSTGDQSIEIEANCANKSPPVDDKQFIQVDLNNISPRTSNGRILSGKVFPSNNFHPQQLQMTQLTSSLDFKRLHRAEHEITSNFVDELADGNAGHNHQTDRRTKAHGKGASASSTLNNSTGNDSMNVVSSFTLFKSNRNVVPLLAVIAFVAIATALLSHGTVFNGETVERLEDSFAAPFTSVNNSSDHRGHSLPYGGAKSSLTSASGVLSRTGGFVYKSYYSTKGAAESLMAALTSLVSSSEKRRAQLSAIKNINAQKSSEKVNDNENSVLQTDDDNDDEDNFVSVETSCNKYVGTIEDGSFAFKGIAYALPPTGDLRWSRPVPHECNGKKQRTDGEISTSNVNKTVKHTYHALKFASDCFQVNPFTKKFTGSEDCLYLNVWTPTIDESANLPVLVWIHGGFLQFGSSHSLIGPSGHLAHKLNVVLISVNYRLHALGFLALDLLSNSGPNSARGNYGLWDQLSALNWIKSNIQSFGGDVNRITVAGSDGSAGTIVALASNPLITGDLFSKVWLIGPALYANKTYETVASKNFHTFQQRSGCYNVTCLKNLSPQRVTKLYLGSDDPAFRINDQNDLPIQGIYPEQLINIDGELVTEAMLTDSLKFNGELNPFTQDFLIGTAYESIDFWPGPIDLSSWSWSQYVKYVTTSLDSFGPKLSGEALKLYPPSDDGDESHFTYSLESSSDITSDKVSQLTDNSDNASRVSSSSQLRNNEILVDEDTFTISPASSSETVNSTVAATVLPDEVTSSPSPPLQVTSSSSNVSHFSSLNMDVDEETISPSGNLTDSPDFVDTNVSSVSYEMVTEAPTPRVNSESHVTPEKLYSSLVSDVRQVCPVRRLASQLISEASRGKNNHHVSQVYLYTVTSNPSAPVRVYDYPSKMSFHLWDAGAFFTPSLESILNVSPSPSDVHFQETIRSLVKQFIHRPARGSGGHQLASSETADVSSGDLLPLPGDTLVISSSNVSYVTDYKSTKCSFWQSQGLLEYAWVS